MKFRILNLPVSAVPVIVLLFSGCAGIPRNTVPESAEISPERFINWNGVLVAGAYTEEDHKIDNWDNAIEGMLELLLNSGFSAENIRMHSSRPQNIGQSRRGVSIEPAWKSRITRSIRNFNLKESDGLFLYFSSHGFDNQGLYLESEEDFRNVFSPEELDNILDPLGEIPIVIFISACFSGDFISGDGSIADENRLILTASAEDRSSFGCGAGSIMPEWDYSLLSILKSVDADDSWKEVIAHIDEDIARKEAGIAEDRKSLPQYYMPSPLHPGFGDLLQRLSRNLN